MKKLLIIALLAGFTLNSLKKNGTIIFNMLSSPAPEIRFAENILSRHELDSKIFRHVEKTNNVLIATFTNKD